MSFSNEKRFWSIGHFGHRKMKDPVLHCLPESRIVNSAFIKWDQKSWWRHQMETFSASLAICAGNSLISSEFPAQRPVTWSFDVFFDLGLNKRLSKQSWGWWFETPSCPLWRYASVYYGVCEHSSPHHMLNALPSRIVMSPSQYAHGFIMTPCRAFFPQNDKIIRIKRRFMRRIIILERAS